MKYSLEIYNGSEIIAVVVVAVVAVVIAEKKANPQQPYNSRRSRY